MVFEEMYNVMIIFTKTYIGKTDLAPTGLLKGGGHMFNILRLCYKAKNKVSPVSCLPTHHNF